MTTAYAVLWLEEEEGRVVVAAAGIYSESAPTAPFSKYPVVLAKVTGHDFDHAQRRLRRRLPHLLIGQSTLLSLFDLAPLDA